MIKENYEFLLTLVEDTERYEDIRLHLKYCTSKELSVNERTCFYNCYKKIIQSRRNVWHPVYILEKKELGKSKVISWYRKKLEDELEEICKEVFMIADFQLKVVKTVDFKAFYLKTKGDYFRYQAEYHCVPENKDHYGINAVQNAFFAYEQASEIVLSELPPTNPLRLSLALNFSVFFYEIMKSSDRALLIARMAYQDGLADLSGVEGQIRKETEKLLGMINENIVLWSSEVQ